MNGKDVARLRKKLGMNQTTFGKLFGYSYPQTRISRIENRRKDLNIRLADLIKMKVADILERGEKK